MKKQEKPQLDPIPPFELSIDTSILTRVGHAIGEVGISDCKTGDVRHVMELLAGLIFVEDLAPGLLSNMLSVLVPHYLGRLRLETLTELMEREAAKKGATEEYKRVMEAAKRRKKGDLSASLIAYLMKAEGMTQVDAIREYEAHSGKQEESIKKDIYRYGKKSKK